MPTLPQPKNAPRPFYWDILAALAFFGQAIFLGKIMSRALGPVAGLFVVLVNAGLGWFFAKAAWRALTEKKR